MSTKQVQQEIISTLNSQQAMTLDDIMQRLGSGVPANRRQVVAAVVPLLHNRKVLFTLERKFSLAPQPGPTA